MIYKGSKYGSITDQVRNAGEVYVENNHNIPTSMILDFKKRMDEINPSLVHSANQTLLDRFASFSSSIDGFYGSQPTIYGRRPYLPEYEDLTRQDFPVPRALANRIFRMFYKLDPLVSNGIDLYGDSAFSDFDLIGEGIKGEIKNTLDSMVDRVGLYNILTSIVKEMLVTGDAIPHCHYDENVGAWSFVALYNPDQIEVIYTPFADMEPILHFIPDEKLVSILSSSHHATARLRASMPRGLAERLLKKEPIELSPVHCTLLSRKLHPYEARGTSIMSRLWRIFAMEDAIFNATIQTARRAAAPLRVAQIGDAQNGIAGTPQQEQDLKRNLALAEHDPASWLVLNTAVKFDTIGIGDRVMSIDRHWDTIERIKLLALGINRGLILGESTYASTQGGLTIWMQRNANLRRMIEKSWLYPKFFLPVSIANQWIKPKEAEIGLKGSKNKSPYIRVRRGHRELLEDSRYIVPHVKWQRQLDPNIDEDKIAAISTLHQMGIKVSESAIFSAAGMDFENDLKQQAQDMRLKEEILGPIPPNQGTGGPVSPSPLPSADPAAFEDFGDGGAPESDLTPPGGAPGSESGDGIVGRVAFKDYDIRDLEDIMLTGKPMNLEESIWDGLIDDDFSTAVIMDDRSNMWRLTEAFLYRNGFSPNEIDGLRSDLIKRKLIPNVVNKYSKLEHSLDKEASSDVNYLSGNANSSGKLTSGTRFELKQRFNLS